MIKRLTVLIFCLVLHLFNPHKIFAETPEYSLEISFNIHSSELTGIASFDVAGNNQLLTILTANLNIDQISLNGKKVDFTVDKGVLKLTPMEKGNLEINYRGIYNGQRYDADNNAGTSEGIINDAGIFLTGTWYPQLQGLFKYNLRAFLPDGYEAVSEAERIIKHSNNGKAEFIFEFPYVSDGINFIATNRYLVINDHYNDIEIYAYFFKEDLSLARSYIEHTKKYLSMYENLLGRYPYRRFSIVENFLPTGYSMPTYTLLGQDIVRLPFIVETSLGHEILHQWFGNFVYIDYQKGNWAEGLTTYLSDHLYDEQKGKGWEHRKQILINYKSYVNDKNEFPVNDFVTRTDFSSKAIGYGKAAMVFHMLKNIVGEELFYKSLRDLIAKKHFQRASWNDIKNVFEDNFQKDLDWFFHQWIYKKGIPRLSFESVSIKNSANMIKVSFDVVQRSGVFALNLPVTFYMSGGGRVTNLLTISGEKDTFRFYFNDGVTKMVIDEDYDIIRDISKDEYPAVISRLVGAQNLVIVPPVKDREIYKDIIDSFKERGGIEKDAKDIRDPDIKSSSLLILGSDNPLTGRLFGRMPAESGFGLTVKENPLNPDGVAAILSSKSYAETGAAYKKVFHYGKYSAVSFDQGRNVAKIIEESQRGMRVPIKDEAIVIDVAAIRSLSDIIDDVAQKKIIYVGEVHDKYAHHDIQLQIIRGLYKKSKKIAIGMEMFQRPFQNALNEYISGTIDEREFLKKSEYFKRWAFDYNLYKPILDFAKAEKIPVIALNIRREIVSKVGSGGIDSLTEEEKKEIPPDIDLSDFEYKERLKSTFDQHGGRERNFDFFFESQVLWDESMSEAIDVYMKSNPEYQMVVLAGNGHLMYGSGIPKRTFRRNGLEYSIILNEVEVDKNIANYIIQPKPVEEVYAPKLLVRLKEDGGRVYINEFAKDSPAEKAGIKTEDIILSLDDVLINDVDDMRIHLLYKKKGDIVKVKVIRKRFLLGDTIMSFDVQL